MKVRLATPLFALLAMFTGVAGAATITLAPSAPEVIEDSLFTVDLKLNATDAPGSHPGLYIGQIIIDFNPAQLEYQGFAFLAPVQQKNAPTTGSAGSQQTVTLGFQNATDLSTIGTFTFRALGSAGTTAAIGIADADDFFGSFVSKLPTDQPFTPQFSGTSVSISAVPLPATAWLFLTAFGLTGARQRWFARRRT
jgi:hypothetical protein